VKAQQRNREYYTAADLGLSLVGPPASHFDRRTFDWSPRTGHGWRSCAYTGRSRRAASRAMVPPPT